MTDTDQSPIDRLTIAAHTDDPWSTVPVRKDDLIELLKLAAQAPQRRFRHRKRGSTYVLIGEAELRGASVKEGTPLIVYRSLGRLWAHTSVDDTGDSPVIGWAELQCSFALRAGCLLAVYRCESDSRLWARPTTEFNDGRFEEIPANG